MQPRATIYEKLVSILTELFEVEESLISEESQLYDDLDIDSIDAVDMIVELKSFTGKKISPEDFKSVRTVGDVVDAVCELLGNE